MSYWTVLGYAFLPFLGNLIGSLLGEKTKPSKFANGLALHWSAGMILSVVGVQIMPKVLGAQTKWPIILAIIAGGIIAVVASKFIKKISQKGGSSKGQWTVFFAVFIDLLGDGITIGASAAISSNFALLVVAGIFLGDLPEGYVNNETFKTQGLSKKKRYLMILGLLIPLLTGAVMSYWIGNGSSETIKFSLIAFTAGMYLRAAVEDMIQKSHSEEKTGSWQQVFFIFGFVSYFIVVMYFGGENNGNRA